MLLGIDIGNTHIVIGYFKDDKLLKKWRVSTDEKKTEDEYAGLITNFIKTNKIKQSIISSVVPNLNRTFKKMIQKYYNIEPMMVSPDLKLNINFKYPHPEEIGADRIVNACAAVKIYGPPLIVIDFGTATTFCFIDKESSYQGGLILPGVLLMIRALHQGTAKLPEVEIKKPEQIIGANTVESIQAGLYYQAVGSINYITDLLLKNYDKKSKIIITGGLAPMFKDHIIPHPVIDQDLTLKGLHILHKMNK
ncbi:MAG: type III pantothenate kinase [Spirochaetes bacterium]|nr:type III pantothenate kinase [Spirochaetota bacterium]